MPLCYIRARQNFYLLIVTRYVLLVTRCFLLVTRCFLMVTPYFLLVIMNKASGNHE